MPTTPVSLILLASAGLGIYMFLKCLRGERNGGGMIALHLILGGAALGAARSHTGRGSYR